MFRVLESEGLGRVSKAYSRFSRSSGIRSSTNSTGINRDSTGIGSRTGLLSSHPFYQYALRHANQWLSSILPSMQLESLETAVVRSHDERYSLYVETTATESR